MNCNFFILYNKTNLFLFIYITSMFVFVLRRTSLSFRRVRRLWIALVIALGRGTVRSASRRVRLGDGSASASFVGECARLRGFDLQSRSSIKKKFPTRERGGLNE